MKIGHFPAKCVGFHKDYPTRYRAMENGRNEQFHGNRNYDKN